MIKLRQLKFNSLVTKVTKMHKRQTTHAFLLMFEQLWLAGESIN
jgi:hypothetical protein